MSDTLDSALNTINILAETLDQVSEEKRSTLYLLRGVLSECEGCIEAAHALVASIPDPDHDSAEYDEPQSDEVEIDEEALRRSQVFPPTEDDHLPSDASDWFR